MVIHSRRKTTKIGQKRKILRKPRRVRLAIECSPDERKFMKIQAARAEKTLNEFVLECVRMQIYKCSHSHIPNKKTKAALRAAEKEEDLIHFESTEDFIQSLKK